MDNLFKKIPIFPLRGALLLPSGNLPLNIFEPKYISMVNYALKKDKLIGMIQPKTKNSGEFFNVGCVGKITAFNETNDNRYIINLEGLSKFQIKNEVKHSDDFKMFNIKYFDKKINFNKFDHRLFKKEKFIGKVKLFFDKKGFEVNFDSFKQINDKSLIIMIAMISPFSINEKQALLECKDINALANTIGSLFDFEINHLNTYETIN